MSYFRFIIKKHLVLLPLPETTRASSRIIPPTTRVVLRPSSIRNVSTTDSRSGIIPMVEVKERIEEGERTTKRGLTASSRRPKAAKKSRRTRWDSSSGHRTLSCKSKTGKSPSTVRTCRRPTPVY